MACDLTTTLDAACTSGIGKLQTRTELLQVWSQLACTGFTPPCTGAPPAPVMLPAPMDGNNIYTLEWEPSPGADGYLLDVGEVPDFAFYIFQDEPVAGTSFVIDDVSGPVRLARVRAYNNCGISDYSNTIAYILIPDMVIGVGAEYPAFTDVAKTTPATNGTTVANWENQASVGALVGVDFLQATAGSRPLFSTGGAGGLPKLTFASDFLQLLGSISSPYTIFFVGYYTGNSGSTGVYICGSSSNPQIASPSAGGPSSHYIYASAVAAGNIDLNLAGPFPGVCIASFPTAPFGYHYVNTLNSGAGGTFNVTLTNTTIGGFPGDPNSFILGDLHEVRVYPRELTVQERTDLFTYAKAKWGLPY